MNWQYNQKNHRYLSNILHTTVVIPFFYVKIDMEVWQSSIYFMFTLLHLKKYILYLAHKVWLLV